MKIRMLELIKLAVQKSSYYIIETYTKHGEHTLNMACPGVGILEGSIKKIQDKYILIFNKLDDEVLPTNIGLCFDINGIVSDYITTINTTVEADNRSISIATNETQSKINDIQWERVGDIGIVDEISERKGKQQNYIQVDTSKYEYRFKCRCGEYRYCKPQDIKQVKLCRACTKEERKARHAAKQREKRRKAHK